MVKKKTTDGVERARVLRHLRELVAALDRRVPHCDRAGEVQMARDAAELRDKALKRIAELESRFHRSNVDKAFRRLLDAAGLDPAPDAPHICLLAAPGGRAYYLRQSAVGTQRY